MSCLPSFLRFVTIKFRVIEVSVGNKRWLEDLVTAGIFYRHWERLIGASMQHKWIILDSKAFLE